MLLKEKKLQQVLDITQRTGVKEKTMTCYKTISLLNIMMSEWWNSRHVALRGLSEKSGEGASPFSDTKPFSKLMEVKVAHVVALIAIRCVSQKNNLHISLSI